MSDLIDRQAAIDAPVKMVSEGLDWIPVYHLKDLPSAEPEERTEERTETHACDCISRQAAKDVVDMELDSIDHVPEWVYDRLLTALDKVPSAEPEQKCKSCRYRNLEWYEEPCDSCTMGGDGCHYKPERKKV